MTYQSKHHTLYVSKRWQKIRRMVLLREPFCRSCMKRGRLVPAVQVDHIVPLEDGGATYDESNLQPLCRSCHSAKSFSGQKGAKEREKGCTEAGLPLDAAAWWGCW